MCFLAAQVFGPISSLWHLASASYSQLIATQPTKLPPLGQFIRRRLGRLYPLHILNLALAVILSYNERRQFRSRLFVEVPLIQVWVPFNQLGLTFGADWNGPTWFLSNLFMHWIFWHRLFAKIHKMNSRTCLIVLCSTFVVTCCRVQAVHFLECLPQGYKWRSPFLSVLFFNPIASFNLFLCGMCLAKLVFIRKTQCQASLEAPTVRGVGGLLAVMMISVLCGWGAHIQPRWHQWGISMPITCLLIWSVTHAGDILGAITRLRPFIWCEKLAYPMFVSTYNFSFFFKRFEEAVAEQLRGVIVFFGGLAFFLFLHYAVEARVHTGRRRMKEE